jgi:hypothetical protein
MENARESMRARQYEEKMKIRGSDELYRLLAVAHML